MPKSYSGRPTEIGLRHEHGTSGSLSTSVAALAVSGKIIVERVRPKKYRLPTACSFRALTMPCLKRLGCKARHPAVGRNTPNILTTSHNPGVWVMKFHAGRRPRSPSSPPVDQSHGIGRSRTQPPLYKWARNSALWSPCRHGRAILCTPLQARAEAERFFTVIFRQPRVRGSPSSISNNRRLPASRVEFPHASRGNRAHGAPCLPGRHSPTPTQTKRRS